MGKRVVAGMLYVLALIFVPSAVFAQASLTGVVRDTSGAVLPGVTVEAASPALIERVRSTVTDADGLYRIVDLRPGTYSVTATLPGFSTVKRDGIELAGSATLTIPIEMRVGGLEETITVTGETPVVDVQNTRRETVLDSEVIQNLPATRAYGSLLNASPGLTVDNNGQAPTPTMTFFSAHGGRTNEGRMQINGMTVAAAFNGGGVSSLTYDTNNVEEVSVLVSGGLGESETGGPVMNLVPRSGGNDFRGQAFYNTAGRWSSSSNIDDELRAIGLNNPPDIVKSYDVSASLGGPIKRDKLWFFGSYRRYLTAQAIEGLGLNRFAGDPSHWDYAADLTSGIEPRNVQRRDIMSGRLTAQATQKNRFTFSHEYQTRCQGGTYTTSGEGCMQRGDDWIGLGSTVFSPEAAVAGDVGYYDMPYYVTQATWTSPISNKVLLEAGYSRFSYEHAGGPGQAAPDGIFNLTPVLEQSAIDGHRANFTYRGVGQYQDNWGNPNSWRASASYVTGAHNAKVGYQGAYLVARSRFVINETGLTYRFNNRTPNQFTYFLNDFKNDNRTRQDSFFIQDTWTRRNLTVQGALRYDRAWSWSPAEGNGTSTSFTVGNLTTPTVSVGRTEGVNAFNDISPRFGASYDVFGNGRTAIKFNMGRYLAPATNDTIYTANAPSTRIVRQVARSWTDANGNFVVDCDLTNPASNTTAGGDTCGALTGDTLNFGRAGSGGVFENALGGWGVRPVDWQYGINVQQQLIPRVSIEAGYNRRWWGNYTVVDNLAVGPQDYERWTINAPQDPRLPNGGGYPIDVYTLTAAAAARPANNWTRLESDLSPEGEGRTHYWHGVDLTANARLRQGVVLQVGTTTGRAIMDTCATQLLIDSPDPRNCRSVDPWETTLRGLASYTIPKIDVLVSSTLRSQPALLLAANYLVPNTLVQGILGRIPPGGVATGNTTVALVDSGAQAGSNRLYAEGRRNQIDMRFAKVFRFGTRRADVGIDLTNLLNTNYATAYEAQYAFTGNGGTFLNPTTITAPRFARFNFTLNF